MKFVHDKTGNVYDLLGFALEEKTLTVLVTYRRADGSGPEWTRPADEFFDGRFTPVLDTPQLQQAVRCNCDDIGEGPCPVHYESQYEELRKAYESLRDDYNRLAMATQKSQVVLPQPITERPGAVLIATEAGTMIGHLDPDATGGSGTLG